MIKTLLFELKVKILLKYFLCILVFMNFTNVKAAASQCFSIEMFIEDKHTGEKPPCDIFASIAKKRELGEVFSFNEKSIIKKNLPPGYLRYPIVRSLLSNAGQANSKIVSFDVAFSEIDLVNQSILLVPSGEFTSKHLAYVFAFTALKIEALELLFSGRRLEAFRSSLKIQIEGSSIADTVRDIPVSNLHCIVEVDLPSIPLADIVKSSSFYSCIGKK